MGSQHGDDGRVHVGFGAQIKVEAAVQHFGLLGAHSKAKAHQQHRQQKTNVRPGVVIVHHSAIIKSNRVKINRA